MAPSRRVVARLRSTIQIRILGEKIDVGFGLSHLQANPFVHLVGRSATRWASSLAASDAKYVGARGKVIEATLLRPTFRRPTRPS